MRIIRRWVFVCFFFFFLFNLHEKCEFVVLGRAHKAEGIEQMPHFARVVPK